LGIDIKIRLLKLGKTQRWALEQLKHRGYSTMTEQRLSNIIRGVYTIGCAREVLEALNQIIDEAEKEQRETT